MLGGSSIQRIPGGARALVSPGFDLRTIVEVVSAASSPAQVYKDDARSRVVRVVVEGQAWIVKSHRRPPWQMRVYRRLRITPGWKEWKSARRLTGTGVRFNAPAAIVWTGPTEYLVSLYVEGEPLYGRLYWSAPLAGLPAEARRDRRSLARSIGMQIGALTAAGLINRDHKPSNLIVDAACDSGDQPVLIDLPGVRPMRSKEQVTRMIVNLYISTEATWNIALSECVACLNGVIAADPRIAEGNTISAKRRALFNRVKRAADAMPRSTREAHPALPRRKSPG